MRTEAEEIAHAERMHQERRKAFQEALSLGKLTAARALAARYDWSLEELVDELLVWFENSRVD